MPLKRSIDVASSLVHWENNLATSTADLGSPVNIDIIFKPDTDSKRA